MNLIPYALLFLGFAACVVGVWRGIEGEVSVPDIAVIVVGALILVLGVVQLYFRPPERIIRLSQNFGPEGWIGFLKENEEADLVSNCDYRSFVDPESYNRLPHLVREALSFRGDRILSFDARNRAFLPLDQERTPARDLDGEDYLDLVRQRLDGVERYFEENEPNWHIEANVRRIAPVSENRQLVLYFPKFMFHGDRQCTGTITVGQNLG